MSANRRIIFGSHVIATRTDDAENTDINHIEFDSVLPGKFNLLGGKGIAAIENTQWGDAWVTLVPSVDQAFTWGSADIWENQGTIWDLGSGEVVSSEVTITTSPVRLSEESSNLAFLYVKNTGSTNKVLLSLNGLLGTYSIEIPPGGSVNLRSGSRDLDCNSVCVKSNADTTTIQYVLAI